MADVRKMKETMIIIGSGAAGLSVALEFAKNGTRSILISDMPSERAQSVMAEGGINAAMDTQRDCPELHAEGDNESWKIYCRFQSSTSNDRRSPKDHKRFI